MSSYSSDSDDTAGFMRKLFPSRKRDHIPKKFNIWGDSDSDDNYKPEAESIPVGGGGGGGGGDGSDSDSDESRIRARSDDDDEDEKSPKTPQKPKNVEKKYEDETDPFSARKVESEETAPAESSSSLTPLSPELQRIAQDVAKAASDPKILAALQSDKTLERIAAKKDISTMATRGVSRALRTGQLPRSKAAAFESRLSAVAISSARGQARSSTAGKSSAPLNKSMLEKLNEALSEGK